MPKAELTRCLPCRKDAYGFFLQPVDLSLVPGYLDIIKRPMDFGTISNKVDRGKYRSLEEFAVCGHHNDSSSEQD